MKIDLKLNFAVPETVYFIWYHMPRVQR